LSALTVGAARALAARGALPFALDRAVLRGGAWASRIAVGSAALAYLAAGAGTLRLGGAWCVLGATLARTTRAGASRAALAVGAAGALFPRGALGPHGLGAAGAGGESRVLDGLLDGLERDRLGRPLDGCQAGGKVHVSCYTRAESRD